MPKSYLRNELILIQKRIVEQLKQEIRNSVGRESRELVQYREEYLDELAAGYKRTATSAEVIQAVKSADIVFFGDFHTLRQAQRIPLRILRERAPWNRDIVVALETFMIKHQPHLDGFMGGRIDEAQLLEKTDFNRTWGFPWEYYRDLATLAREKGGRLVGINSSPRSWKRRLYLRDSAAAEVIARESADRPGSLVCVLDGDLHLASSHLPLRVQEALEQRGVKRRILILFQNYEEIYWDLVEKRKEHQTAAVWLGRNRYCVINCPPLIKFQSYINWLEGCGELDYSSRSGWKLRGDEEVDFHEQVLRLIRIIAALIGIENDRLSDFVVYAADDLDFLDRLQEQGLFSPPEIEVIAAQIKKAESYFIHRANIIYLGNLSINHAAEEASHFINEVCAEFREGPLPMKADFYYRTLREALGFFGSKIVNPHRPCYSEKDFKKFVQRGRYWRTDPRLQELRAIGKHVRRHKEYERKWALAGGKVRGLRTIYDLPTDLHLGVTHALGYMLGDRMFRSMLSGRLSKEKIRDLFGERFETRDSAFDAYMDLAARLFRWKSG